MSYKLSRILTAIVFFLLIGWEKGLAQCATCKAAAATKDESGDLVVGAGLNTAILYLLALPFIIGGVMAWLWFRHKRQQEAAHSS